MFRLTRENVGSTRGFLLQFNVMILCFLIMINVLSSSLFKIEEIGRSQHEIYLRYEFLKGPKTSSAVCSAPCTLSAQIVQF